MQTDGRSSTVCLTFLVRLAYVVFAAILCVPGTVAAAAESAPESAILRMTLSEALSYARNHQSQIQAALAEWRARRAEAKIPRAAWLPQVGATAQLIYGTANNTTASYLNVPEVDIPRIGASRSASSGSWFPHPSTLAAISIGQEVYDFGRLAAQIAISDALADVAHANSEAVLLDVELGVEEAFHGVLAAKAVLSATEEAHQRAIVHRDFAQAGVRNGLRPPIDLTRAHSEVAQLELRLIRAQTGLRAARAALASSIGSDALEVDALPFEGGQPSTPTFTEALRRASVKNPLVLIALARLRARESTTRATMRELLPNLFASAGLSGRAGGAAPSSGSADIPYGEGWLPDVANWHLGVFLQWNIFDGTVLAKRAASKTREEAARAELDTARQSTVLAVERAYLDLDAASKSLPGLTAALQAARANHSQAEARFKAGLGTVVELTDAEALLTSAELDLAIGQFAIVRARAVLGRVMAERSAP
jgi:outer membrane protein